MSSAPRTSVGALRSNIEQGCIHIQYRDSEIRLAWKPERNATGCEAHESALQCSLSSPDRKGNRKYTGNAENLKLVDKDLGDRP